MKVTLQYDRKRFHEISIKVDSLKTFIIPVPPSPPLPQLSAVRPNCLSVQWSDHLDGGSPVTSYQVFYREQFSSWKMISVEPQYRQKEVYNLK